MVRSKLVLRLLNRYPELTLEDARMVVDIFFDEITEALVRRDRVEVRGFGSFSTVLHNARTGRNPRTGIPVDVEEKRFVRFKASKQLLKRLNPEDDLSDGQTGVQ